VTDDNRSSASDPFGDFQRWLMRSSARSLSRELKGQARRTFGGGSSRDVWETATAEPIPAEAPECAWCPVCRAARRLRLSGPGLASHVAGAGDALLTAAQDTLTAFEATLSARPPEAWPGSPAGPEPSAGSSEGTGWPAEPDPGLVPAPMPPAEPGAADARPTQAAEASPAQAAEPEAANTSLAQGTAGAVDASPAQAAEPEAANTSLAQGTAGAVDASPAQAAEPEAATAGAADASPAQTAEAAEAREGQSAASDEPDRRS
jgi:hypothetical protein